MLQSRVYYDRIPVNRLPQVAQWAEAWLAGESQARIGRRCGLTGASISVYLRRFVVQFAPAAAGHYGTPFPPPLATRRDDLQAALRHWQLNPAPPRPTDPVALLIHRIAALEERCTRLEAALLAAADRLRD